MKTRIFLRLAQYGRRTLVKASSKPNFEPLFRVSGRWSQKHYLPTVNFALDVKIPDSEFNAAKLLLEAKISGSKPAIEIKQAQEESKEGQ